MGSHRAGHGSGNVALSRYQRVRNESDVGAFGTRIVASEHAEQIRRGKAPPGRGHLFRGGGVMDQLIERCCGLDEPRARLVVHGIVIWDV